MREHLRQLSESLQCNGEPLLSKRVNSVLASSDEEMEAFLVSNELWGGSGSIADQAGVSNPNRNGRRAIEAALVQLGHEQLRQGKVNSRTSMWVQAFEQWSRNGI